MSLADYQRLYGNKVVTVTNFDKVQSILVNKFSFSRILEMYMRMNEDEEKAHYIHTVYIMKKILRCPRPVTNF